MFRLRAVSTSASTIDLTRLNISHCDEEFRAPLPMKTTKESKHLKIDTRAARGVASLYQP